MKQKGKQLNKRMLITIGVVVAISIGCYFCWEGIRFCLKEVLCSGILPVITTIVILFLYIVHYYKVKMRDENFSPILSKSLPPVLDYLFGALTYITFISTSHTLFKGLFLQLSYNEEYFKDFGSIDIGSLILSMAILLWYCISNIAKDVNDLFWEERSLDTSKEIEIIGDKAVDVDS